jgi:hypothetical protein
MDSVMVDSVLHICTGKFQQIETYFEDLLDLLGTWQMIFRTSVCLWECSA